jgi:hypothetical protein
LLLIANCKGNLILAGIIVNLVFFLPLPKQMFPYSFFVALTVPGLKCRCSRVTKEERVTDFTILKSAPRLKQSSMSLKCWDVEVIITGVFASFWRIKYPAEAVEAIERWHVKAKKYNFRGIV